MKKKVLSVALSLSLVMGSFGMAFANNASDADLKVLQDKKVLTGDQNGNLMLEKELKRQDAVILLSRLMGQEEVAKTYPVDMKFVDVVDDFYKPYITWANKNGFFNGMSETMFGFGQVMTVQQFQAVMLRALGYGETKWDEVPAKAKELGFGSEDVKENLTRGHMAGILSKGLRAETKDGKVLANKLNIEMPALIKEVAKVEDVMVTVGAEAKLPSTVKATMEDGTEKDVEVKWASVDTSKEGEFTVDGTIEGFEAGVNAKVKVVAAELKVVEMKSNNLKEFTIKFTRELDKDSAEKKSNYTIDKKAPKSVKLQDDKMTVKVVVEDAEISKSNPAEYKVVVKGVQDTNKKTIEKHEETLKIFDREQPVLEKIELAGRQSIRLTFSEPIKEKPTVKIKNGAYGSTVQTLDGTNEVMVKISSTKLPEAEYDVKVSGYKDYAGIEGDTATLKLDYKEEKGAPEVKVKEAKQDKVTLEFNRMMKKPDSTKNYVDYFYHTYSSFEPDSVKFTDEKDGLFSKVELTFEKHILPEGKQTVVVKYKGSEGVKLEDDWGNKLEENVELSVDIEVDKTAPTVKEIKVVNEKELKVYFSEDMYKGLTGKDSKDSEGTYVGASVDEEKYVVKDSSDKEVKVSSVKFVAKSSDGEYYALVDFGKKLDGGDYTIEFKDLKDASLQENKLDAATQTFTITDKTAPEDVEDSDGNKVKVKADIVLGTESDDDEIIYVTFQEKMATDGEYSVLRAENYQLVVNGTVKELHEDAKLELFGSTGKVVKVTIPNHKEFTSANLSGGKISVKIARVADQAGNKNTSFSDTVAAKSEAKPVVTKVKQIDSNKLEITVDKPLTTLTADAFQTVSGSVYKDVAGIDNWEVNKDNETVIKVTIDADAVTDAMKNDTSKVFDSLKIVGEFMTSETGMKASNANFSSIEEDRKPKFEKPAKDANVIAPTVMSGDDIATASTVVLDFSENLKEDNKQLAQFDLKITYDGKDLVAAKDFEITSISGDKVTVTFNKQLKKDKKVVIKAVEKPQYMQDLNKNVIDEFEQEYKIK